MSMHSVIKVLPLLVCITIIMVFCVSMYVRCGVIVKAALSNYTTQKVHVVTGIKEP